MGVFLGIAALIILWKMSIRQIAAVGVVLFGTFLYLTNKPDEHAAQQQPVRCVKASELAEWEETMRKEAPDDPWRPFDEAMKPVGPPCR